MIVTLTKKDEDEDQFRKVAKELLEQIKDEVNFLRATPKPSGWPAFFLKIAHLVSSELHNAVSRINVD